MRKYRNSINSLKKLLALNSSLQSDYVQRIMRQTLALHVDVAVQQATPDEGLEYQIMCDDDLDFFNEYVDAYPNDQFFTDPVDAAIHYLHNRRIWELNKEVQRLQKHIEEHEHDYDQGDLDGAERERRNTFKD